jgi:hypothetical protein
MDGRSIRTIRCIGRGEPGIGATLLNPPGKAPNRMGGAGADAPVDPCHLRTGKNPGIAGHSNKFYCNFSVLRDAAAERREARIFKSRLRGAIVHAYEARRAPDLGPAALASRRSNLALRGGPRFRLASVRASYLSPATATGQNLATLCAPGRNLRASDTGLPGRGRAAVEGRHPRSALRIASRERPFDERGRCAEYISFVT